MIFNTLDDNIDNILQIIFERIILTNSITVFLLNITGLLTYVF